MTEEILLPVRNLSDEIKRWELRLNLAEKLMQAIFDSPLNDNEQAILIYRYVQLLMYREIAAEMHYSDKTVYKIHKQAREKFLSWEINENDA